MKTEVKEKIIRMLNSHDSEMQQLGLLTFSGLVKSWDEYLGIRDDINPSPYRKKLRSIMINSHGKLRNRFKTK